MKKFLIFIPFHNPWHWHTDYTNQTAILLARHYTVICFLWGDAVSLKEIITKKVAYHPLRKMGRLLLYQPLSVIPGKRLLTAQFANLYLNLIFAYIFCSLLALRQRLTVLFWYFGIYDPVFLLLPVFFRYTPTIYDCVDAPSHPDAKQSARLREIETDILKRAWIVSANSTTQFRRLKSMRSDVHVVPLGFRIESFQNPLRHPLPFPHGAPVVGYVGAIDYRLDIPLLSHLVTRYSKWRFALIGPVFYDHLTPNRARALNTLLQAPNVYHTVVTPRHIPDILRQCRVTIIPYARTLSFNRHSFPMKIMEYFYAGVPVISSHIDELASYPTLVRLMKTRLQWSRAIRHALNSPFTDVERRKARHIALSHTWKKKITQLIRLMRHMDDAGR